MNIVETIIATAQAHENREKKSQVATTTRETMEIPNYVQVRKFTRSFIFPSLRSWFGNDLCQQKHSETVI